MPRKKKDTDVIEFPVNTKETEAIPAEVVKTEEPKGMSLDDLKVGYIVGLTPGGDFIFELFGKEPGLVELLGVHQHAVNKVQQIYNTKQKTGDALVHEVGKATALLHQKVDQLLQVIAPKEPDNKLS